MISPDGDPTSLGPFARASTARPVLRNTETPDHPVRRRGRTLVRSQRERRLILVRYANAVAAVALASLVRMALAPFFGSRAVFAFYYVAVGWTAWSAGIGPALVAVTLGAICASWFFLPPLSIESTHSDSMVDIVAYLVVGLLAVWLGDNQRRATVAADTNAREARATREALREADRQTVDILESISDAFAAFDREWNCVRLNRRAADLFGVSRTEMIGANLWSRFPGLYGTDYERELRRVSDEGVSVRFETRHAGSDEWYETHAIPTQTGIAVYFIDISQRKRHESEVGALNARLQRAMRETHHRVKNNLQVIEAMIDMQVLEGAPAVPTEEVRRIGRHVQSLAALHDLLTEQAKQDNDVQYLSSTAVLDRLRPTLEATLGGRTLALHGDEIVLTVRQCSALTMLVNELVSNAVKHGTGAIRVKLQLGEYNACLVVEDEGRGFPSDFDPVKSSHTGLSLIESLSRWDLGGDVHYTRRPGGGARVVVEFPLETPQDH